MELGRLPIHITRNMSCLHACQGRFEALSSFSRTLDERHDKKNGNEHRRAFEIRVHSIA